MDTSSLPHYFKNKANSRNKSGDKSYVHHFGSAKSLADLTGRAEDGPHKAGSQRLVTYKRLEKIASYHFLPRVTMAKLRRNSTSGSSSSQKSVKLEQKKPLSYFGSLESLESGTTFSYIACREQREREEDIYEMKPDTIVVVRKPSKKVPTLAQTLMEQQYPDFSVPDYNIGKDHQRKHSCTTCIRCYKPKIMR